MAAKKPTAKQKEEAAKAALQNKKDGRKAKEELLEKLDKKNPLEMARILAMSGAKKKWGRSDAIIPAANLDDGLTFIQVPDLLYQWAMQRPGYALGKIRATIGFEGSSKTSSQLWLADLCMQQGGLAGGIFVEHADSTTHMRNYIGAQFLPNFLCYVAETLEEAIDMSYECQRDWEMIDKHIGTSLPKLQIFDSIAGATQERLLEDDAEPGAPRPGGIGKVMADFVNVMHTYIRRTNALWAVNNQAREVQEYGFAGMLPKAEIEKLVAKGGKAVPFHASYFEVLKKGSTLKDSGKAVEGFETKLTFKKNKYGVPMRELHYDVVWGKGFVFQTHTMESFAGSKIMGLNRITGGKYYSKDMGISEKQAIPEEQMYALIHSPEWMPRFQEKLGIITDVNAVTELSGDEHMDSTVTDGEKLAVPAPGKATE